VFLVDALTGIAQPELRAAVLFVRSQTAPVSADDVATHFRVHRTVARGRLERLADAGLLDVTFERRSGRSGPGAGRPTKLYSVRPETTALEFPQRRYEQLVGHLLEVLPEPEREPLLTRVGGDFARDLAAAAGLGPTRGVRSAAERACTALGKLGFQATVSDVGDDSVTITTPTCPLRPLVMSSPEAAAIDRGMWMGLVGAYLPRGRPCSVTCETRNCLDDKASCRVVLDFRTEEGKTCARTGI
jgi:predicted ArsR family transcriptional regulator